ncbi:DUF3048 domain-containing protein [Caldicellulosiruptor naganoensis]|uniref:DUF3048 domain-containing protein n=1 Tax=Caldicellulosiruptor naganoensis TaxID=29324 RepID=A0ABY7BH59_9FIRM|nr:DUF3048 domain-containing protein [Caldicellulosiruptor naganoensis]WAM30684.1 DUF3048 domain-containing protein [Caldicellulosiruptor naganoensis]
MRWICSRNFLYKAFTIAIVIILLVVLLIGCGKKKASVSTGSEVTKVTQPKKQEQVVSDGSRADTYTCKLTGEAIHRGDEHQVIAVMINNEPGAIPQSSLNQAEYLYEALIEGGATRIMAIYHHTYPKKVGPIRSARPYFMQIAKSLNAYYVHCGGSPQAYRLFKQNYIPHIDAIYTGGGIFYRTSDRKAPHNLYSTMENLIRYFDKKGYKKQQSYKFYPLTDRVANKHTLSNSKVKIRFSGWYYVKYEYDPVKRVYMRFVKEKPHIDKETGSQLFAKNLIILVAKYDTIKNDDKGRQEVDFSKGKGYLLQEGRTIPVTYTFDMKNSFTIKDNDGKEIQLLKGNTWFEIVPQYGKVEIK